MRKKKIGKPSLPCVCVDASARFNPGKIEYRAVHHPGDEIFRKSFVLGTSVVGEFLAILDTIRMFADQKVIIYSDNYVAIRWIYYKVCNTWLDYNGLTHDLWIHINEGLEWMKQNEYLPEVRKWHTKEWGENPADFGRKFKKK